MNLSTGKVACLTAVVAALACLTLGSAVATAKGRSYHTILSSHHFKLQACTSKGSMYMRTDSRHNKDGALLRVQAITPPSAETGSARFGAFGGRLSRQGFLAVGTNQIVRIHVKFFKVKHAVRKDVSASRLRPC